MIDGQLVLLALLGILGCALVLTEVVYQEREKFKAKRRVKR